MYHIQYLSYILLIILSSNFPSYDGLCENLKFHLINDYNVTANWAYNISLESLELYEIELIRRRNYSMNHNRLINMYMYTWRGTFSTSNKLLFHGDMHPFTFHEKYKNSSQWLLSRMTIWNIRLQCTVFGLYLFTHEKKLQVNQVRKLNSAYGIVKMRSNIRLIYPLHLSKM